MKKVRYLLLLLISSFLLIPNANAQINSDSKGNGNGGYAASCSTNCQGTMRTQSLGGVRITFIKADGTLLSNSYDYVTKMNYSGKFHYNAYEGDKTKMTGQKDIKEITKTDLPLFSDLINTFNAEPGVSNGIRMSSPYTGGNAMDRYDKEIAWFLELTKPDNPAAGANVRGLANAIAKTGYKIDAEQLIIEIQEGCKDGNEVFIMMEPLTGVYIDSGADHFLGTIRDYALAYNTVPPQASANATLMYYDDNIAAKSFSAFTVSPASYSITSVDQILHDTVGWGAILDWANAPGSTCDEVCFYNAKTKQIIVDDKTYPGALSTYYTEKGFSSLGEYLFTEKTDNPDAAGCCTTVKPVLDKFPELKADYDKYCDGEPEPDCCTDDPLESDYMAGDINNCCYDDTHSWASQYDLNKLFCRDKNLEVNYYLEKCKASEYIDENASLNKYCTMYCTERISIDTPSAISAVSGRYFTLTPNPVGHTTSPYLESYKRCRVKVKYNEWEKDYYDMVDKQIAEYMAFMENEAYNLLYKDSIGKATAASETTTITCSAVTKNASCDVPVSCSDPTKTGCTRHVSYDSNGASFSPIPIVINYTKYPFTSLSTYPYQWKGVKADETKEANHTAVKLVPNAEKNGKTEHGDWSAWSDTLKADIQKADDKIKEFHDHEIPNTSVDGDCGPTGNSKWSCTRNTIEAESRVENVPAEQKKYDGNAQEANGLFKSYAQQAYALENDLSTCDYFFLAKDPVNEGWKVNTKGQEEPENMYQVKTTLGFNYSQIYYGDGGETLMQSLPVVFKETPGCKVTGPYTLLEEKEHEGFYFDKDGNDTETVEDIYQSNYSDIYSAASKEYNEAEDFDEVDLSFGSANNQSTTWFEQFRHDVYKASKVFTHDAKYQSICEWEENDKNLYTTVPSGTVSEHYENNFTIHGREYYVYLSTFKGKYETDWQLENVGEYSSKDKRGTFDSFIDDEGKTCSNDPVDRATRFSCGLEVDYEIVYTGLCNGHNGGETTIYPEDCTPISEGFDLFEFKVVDTSNLFPNGEGVNYAYNWLNTKVGNEAKTEIEDKGKADTTYAKDNLTYSFKLSPTAMRHIKNYNDQQENAMQGGYSDFTLECECPKEVQTNTLENGGVSCTECKSTFLDALSNNQLTYKGNTYKDLKTWNSKDSISNIRSGNRWASK